jgi:hypothetical protein
MTFLRLLRDVMPVRKERRLGADVPLGKTLVAWEFLDVVSLDVGPLPTTEKGNKYLLTFIDHFTRFCEAIPIVRWHRDDC